MPARCLISAAICVTLCGWAQGQQIVPNRDRPAAPGWRTAGEGELRGPAAPQPSALPSDVRPASATVPVAPAAADVNRRPVATVTSGNGTLPNEHGQVWREYDISPYTTRVTSTQRPEQAIVDWIFRDTGFELWHSEPLGVLSANRRTLRVYHTPEVQAKVAEVVDRFLASDGDSIGFGLRVISVDQPNWRTRVQRYLKPVESKSPGVSTWLLEREDAALVLAELQRRNDFREHSAPHLLVSNGQPAVVSAMRPRNYVRDAVARADVWPGYETRMGQVEEGFAVEFSPLLTLDRTMIDAKLKFHVDQVEKMTPVVLEVPTAAAPRQRVKIEVPQMTQYRHEARYRWPVNQVLLVGLGMVALPIPVDGKPSVAGVPLPLGGGPPRADLLVLIEPKTPVADPSRALPSAIREPAAPRGRF
jgi:hypothetical protein